MKPATLMLIALCICAGCATSSPKPVTNIEITKKQDEVLVLESEISIILWNLREVQKKCTMQSSDRASDQKSKGEYATESQGRDLDLTIKVLSECKKNLVKQLKAFRRKYDIWEVD